MNTNFDVHDDETIVCPHCSHEYEQGDLHICPDIQESEELTDYDFS